MRRPLLTVALLAVLALIPGALCAEPLPEEWPPEEEWHPVSVRDWLAERFEGRLPIYLVGDDQDVSVDEGYPVCLWCWWAAVPTNTAYVLSDGEQVTLAYWTLQGRTDAAYCVYEVRMNGERLTFTDTLSATCRWKRTTLEKGMVVEYPDQEVRVVLPTCLYHIYCIVFPDGLDAGEYEIITEMRPTGNSDPYPHGTILYRTAILHVVESQPP